MVCDPPTCLRRALFEQKRLKMKEEERQKKAAEEGQSNSAEPLFKVPLGVQAYTFRNSFPQGVEATLDSIANLGPVVADFLYHTFSANGTTSTLHVFPVCRW